MELHCSEVDSDCRLQKSTTVFEFLLGRKCMLDLMTRSYG